MWNGLKNLKKPFQLKCAIPGKAVSVLSFPDKSGQAVFIRESNNNNRLQIPVGFLAIKSTGSSAACVFDTHFENRYERKKQF